MQSIVDRVAVAVNITNFTFDGTRDTNSLRLPYHFLNGMLCFPCPSDDSPLNSKDRRVNDVCIYAV